MTTSMANQSPLPLYEKFWASHNFKKVIDIFVLILLLLLLSHRLISLNNHTLPWLVAFLCESWFTISWVLTIITRWTPATSKTYPERLLERVNELPPVDLFVTTADDVLEPPIITVNTLLSLLALDYPAHKLACYVSDDACSPLNFYALVEASKFAKIWVPFCKKYNVQIRAPFRYFREEAAIAKSEEESLEFKQERSRMKDEYDRLSRKIEDAARKSIPCQLEGEYTVFSNTEKRNHPTIIKVLWENKDGLSDGLPHIVYISREKRPKHPHHYKAGAMNVLTRISGLMTNAPFTLNVDCDMFVNNPKIVLHAMCILLDSKGQKEVAFVQCPQKFYAGLKDDPFGNQLVALFTYMGSGIAGIQGPYYAGTNCFHRRKVIYGLSADDEENVNIPAAEELLQKFGSSKELLKSAAHALEGKIYSPDNNIFNSIVEASHVAGCGYEYGTQWGKKVGWVYGSSTEDILTGLTIHAKGWRSEMCTPNPMAFTGCAPADGPSSMIQQKRWATGLLEILFCKHCPILGTLFGKLQFRQCIGYLWLCNWGLRPVPEVCYAALPAYCIITNSYFLPKEQALWIPVAVFVIYNIYSLSEYTVIGLSVREWWNNHKMSRILAMNAWLFGVLSIILKLLGISDTVFEITQKEAPTSGDHDGASDADAGRFTFDESPVFVPGITILLVQLSALVIKLLGLQSPAKRGNGSGLGEIFCSVYLVACYWPFFKGLFGKGKYGIPLPTICKSASLAFVFVHLCRRTATG